MKELGDDLHHLDTTKDGVAKVIAGDPPELLTSFSGAFLSERTIISEMEKYIQGYEEKLWLDEHNKNKKTAGLYLKRAEGARAILTKLPAMLEWLRSKTRSWEEVTGRTFFYNEVSLLAALDDPELLRERRRELKLVRQRKAAAEALEELSRLGKTRSCGPVGQDLDDSYWSFMPATGSSEDLENRPAADAEEREQQDSAAAARQKLQTLLRKRRMLTKLSILQTFQYTIIQQVSHLGDVLVEVDRNVKYVESLSPFDCPWSFTWNWSIRAAYNAIEKARSSYKKLVGRVDLDVALKLRAIQQASCAFDMLEQMVDELTETFEAQRRFTLRLLIAAANAFLQINNLLAIDVSDQKLRMGLARPLFLKTLVDFCNYCLWTALDCGEYPSSEAGAGGALLAAELEYSHLFAPIFRICGYHFIGYKIVQRGKERLDIRLAKGLPELAFHVEMLASKIRELEHSDLSPLQVGNDSGLFKDEAPDSDSELDGDDDAMNS